jgi:hypothetical protein
MKAAFISSPLRQKAQENANFASCAFCPSYYYKKMIDPNSRAAMLNKCRYSQV